MKYLKWIFKKGTGWVVAIWTISVVSGIAGWIWLFERYIHYLNGYLSTHLVTIANTDVIIISLIGLFVCGPAWIGYYLSDKRLFYDEYLKDPKNL
jgi:hypothetical protein